MKGTLIVITALLTACSTSAVQPYRSESGERYQIHGQANEMTGKIEISIDGNTVIDDRLSLIDGSGNFTGSHQGQPVNAACNEVLKWYGTELQCQIFINGEHATNLTF